MSLFQKFEPFEAKVSSREDGWIYTEEPHSERRREILKKYPQIMKLMGSDNTVMYYVAIEIVIQLVMCWLLQDSHWSTIMITAYCFGGVVNHSLGCSIHEIGHSLAFGFGRPTWNRALSIFANLPMGIPYAVMYRRYHADHHRYMGDEDKDVDIPTRFESNFFRHPLSKTFWLMMHPFIHSIRPLYKRPKSITKWGLVNATAQFSFNYFIYTVFGSKALVYLIAGTLLALGLHPLSGHFISEHFMFTKGQATNSYYGVCNKFMFNIGYHVEHHDFPYIPWNRLPEVKRIAGEYYDHLPNHTSWAKVVWDFIFNADMGPYARGVGYKKAI